MSGILANGSISLNKDYAQLSSIPSGDTDPLLGIAIEVNETIGPKLSINVPESKSDPIKKADVKTPQNAQSDNWQTAKKIAVVALPIIGLAAFIGLSIGVGMATGGIGFLPLLAGAILLVTCSASVAITLTNPGLWHNMPIPQNPMMKKEEKEEEEKEINNEGHIIQVEKVGFNPLDEQNIENNEEVVIDNPSNGPILNSFGNEGEIEEEIIQADSPIVNNESSARVDDRSDEPKETKKSGMIDRIRNAFKKEDPDSYQF